MIILTCVPAFSVSAADMNTASAFAQKAATIWFMDNYGGFYHIRDLKVIPIKVVKKMESTRYTFSITCETKLKIENVEELPFVAGMRDAVASVQNISNDAEYLIEEYIKDAGRYIGDYYTLALDVVVDVNDANKNEYTLYYQDIQSTFILPITDLLLEEEEMLRSGFESALQIIKSDAAFLTRGYDDYDRIAARDYALTYSSNPIDCYDCGTTCGFRQDRSVWNNSNYYYITNLKHADCADFVSQAMCEGGIPVETNVWDRFNDGPNGWSWTSAPGLKSYMVNKGYWESSTFALCNAGNIIRWVSTSASANHVGMITLNDTVTHRYTAHTNDCKNQIFTNSTYYQNNCEYYMIKGD